MQAFRKTERKTPGDETKKSTEWVLEDFAIKDGVQSTTRYRKGTGAKKFIKSENPQPARQTSGRKGGISASKNKLQRHQRVRDISDSRRSIPRHQILHSQFPSQMRSMRQSSPLTPPNNEMPPACNPYYFAKAEPQPENPYEEICGLEEVQGVYIDDSPVFVHNQDAQFHGGLRRY